ncbi:MAG: hypothetical protein ACRYFZ_01620 [Janthinobacterium lividum]
MSLHQFQQFSPVMQLYWVLRHGIFLAQRWEEATGGVNLYHLLDEGRGFFVEVGIDETQDCFVVLHSFSSSEALAEYTQGVRLPDAL